jgi:D-alanine transaminase
MDAHVRRLDRSLRAVRITGFEAETFPEIARRLAQENGLADGTCYLQITRGAAPRQHAFPEPGTPPTVYACTYSLSASSKPWERGVGVILVPDERWARCNVKSTALLPNVLANQAAKEAGAAEAVFVRDGLVTEGSHTNVAAVFGGRVCTHPEGPRILSGVTRTVVLALCRTLGVPVEERPIPGDALAQADEVFLMSTTSEVLPVVAVGGQPVGAGAPGPVTRALLAAFRAQVGRAAG